MEKELISIIIPVYNVQEYLRRCLDSIINQSYKNLEIILIDDGSTDSSGKICDEYAKKDKRIKVVHKSNGGLADARNVGLNVSLGEYIIFVDSDDWLLKNGIEFQYHILKKENSDLLISPLKVCGDKQPRIHVNDNIETLATMEALEDLLYQKKFSTSAPGKLYKKELWNDIRFETNTLYEDLIPIYQIIQKAQKIIFNSTPIYFYYKREGSITKKEFNIKKLDYIKNCETILDDVKSKYPNLKKGALSRLLWAECHILMYIDRNKYPELTQEIWEDYCGKRIEVLLDKNVKNSNRLIIITSYFGFNFLRKIFKLKNNMGLN